MKLLHITPVAPSNNSGGGVGVLQTLLSLFNNGYELEYVGPEIYEKEYQDLYNRCYILDSENILFRRAWYLLHGITNSRYHAWKNLNINIDKYDAVILDFTKLDYIIPKIGRKKLYVRVHNVEQDYAKRDYLIRHSLAKGIIYLLTKRQEKLLTERADILITLTEEDNVRLQELYPYICKKKLRTIPVCVRKPAERISVHEYKDVIQLLITGSLWFGGNYTGIIWFINDVVPKLRVPFKLIIAGSHPHPKLLKLVQDKDNVLLIDSPQNMSPYFKSSDLILAPIFQGAGMKVKIAEALSYGKPIVGTSHAFTGYDIQHRVNSYVANSAEEFLEAVESYYRLSKREKDIMGVSAYNLYSRKYSLSRSSEMWKQILSE